MGTAHRLGDRRLCEADVLGYLRVLGVGQIAGCYRRVDPHRAVAVGEQVLVFHEAVRGGAAGAVLGQQGEIHVQSFVPGRSGQLGLPFHVEPAPAIGVHHGVEQGHVLAPARHAAQADAVDVIGRVVELLGELLDLVPGRALGHRQAGFLEQILAVVGEGRFGVERQRVKLTLVGQRLTNRLHHVLEVVGFGQIVQRCDPAVLSPDRCGIGPQGNDVVAAGLLRDVQRHLLTQFVFGHHIPAHLDVGVGLFEFWGQALHHDHLWVVDGRYGDLRLRLSVQRGARTQCEGGYC